MRISDWSSDVCSSDLPVVGHDRPSIVLGSDLARTLIDHRFDRENHAFAQTHARVRPPEIHHLRLFVHLATNAVPAKFTHNRIAVLFGVPIDCEADGADIDASPHLPSARSEEHTSYLQSLIR